MKKHLNAFCDFFDSLYGERPTIHEKVMREEKGRFMIFESIFLIYDQGGNSIVYFVEGANEEELKGLEKLWQQYTTQLKQTKSGEEPNV